jgi:NAD(P)-dependent dehydrogenase (short-subunit alcohol dehydrogenase family)
MEVAGKIIAVTGGANGIGASIARRCAELGARAIAVLDIDYLRAADLASALGGAAFAVRCDVSHETSIQEAVAHVKARCGRIDMYFSNAGILGQPGGIEVSDQIWDRMWRVHAMAHVWAARAIVPEMVERGGGCFAVTASAAGLLNIVESAPYGVTKHAAVAFAEWLRIAYGKQGLRVACLCPQLVQTDLVSADQAASAGLDGILAPAQVAEALIQTIREDRFLCLPHTEVAQYVLNKAQDNERWLKGMQKLRAAFVSRASR